MPLCRLERALARRGWYFHHQRGSHRTYCHETTGRKLVLAVHGGPSTPVSWRQIACAWRDVARLEREVAA